jgi:hypothetical protein
MLDENVTQLVTLDSESLGSQPSTAAARAGLRKTFEQDLHYRFQQWLPKELKDAFRRPPAANTNAENERIVQEFDKFIIFRVQSIGPRLLLSDVVIERLMEWNKRPTAGIRLLEQFMKAMVHGAKVRDGQAKADVGPFWYAHKVAVIPELNVLQRQVRAASNVESVKTSWDLVEYALCAKPQAFPRLYQNLSSLKNFCENNVETCNCFVAGSIKGSPFFDQWGAWSTNRDTESFRQMVSRSRPA